MIKTGAINWGNPINRSCGLNAGLVGWWFPRPGVNGNTWYDLCGLNHGTLTNGPTRPIDSLNRGTPAISFDGTDDNVDLGSNPSLNLPGECTLTFWHLTNGVYATQQALFAQSNGTFGHGAALFGKTANKYTFWISASGTNLVSGATSISTDAWRRVVFTRSGTTGSWSGAIYLNGLVDATGTTASNPENTGTLYPSRFGEFGSYAGYYLNGRIAEAKIYSRSLSAAEAWQDYQDATTGYPLTLNRIERRWGYVAAVGGGSAIWNSQRQRFNKALIRM